MKNVTILFLSVLIFCSCGGPRYLPKAKAVGSAVRGGYVTLTDKNRDRIKGELIALSETHVILLSKSANKCLTLPIANVHKFKIRYARSTQYAWTIPVYTLISISHGFIGILTLPFNLISTIATTVSSANSHCLNSNQININELKLFARFPQGVPETVDIGLIRWE